MLSDMPLAEFCEWYVHFYELKFPPDKDAYSQPVLATSAEEEIASLKAQFSNTADS